MILRGWSRREKISFVSRSGVSSVLRQEQGGSCFLHGLGVAHLMRVGGGSERDEDGGASGGGYFRDSDCARSADDQVRLGKPLRHVLDEGHDLRLKFASCIRDANCIIVTFASLMHDEKLIFSRQQQIERVNYGAIDRQVRRGCRR